MRFEPLEVRALLSVSPGGGLDELGPDPAASVLAAPSMSGQSTSWIDTLTAEQAQVRDELHALLSRGGTILELEDFQPVLMPEAFLDELYDTYGVQQTWNSLRWQMDALFGTDVLMYRDDTPGFFDVFQDFEVIDHPDSVPWVDALTPEQAQVRDELHALLSRGGTIAELENFQPVLMPEAFLDELYDTYGVTQTYESLRAQMGALFGVDTLLNRRDTPGEFYNSVDTSWRDSLTPEQAKTREEVLSVVSRGGKIEELEGFEPVLMPEAFLDELYDAYGVTQTYESLRLQMGKLFGIDTLASRRDTPGEVYLAQSVDLIGGFDLHLDYPALGGGAGYAIAVLDTGFDVDHPVFGPDNDSNGVADRIVHQEDFGDPSDAADRADTSDYTSNHGTIVASVAAGVEWRQSPLPDASRTGVARGADLVLLKVTKDDGTFNAGTIEAALQWVTQHVTEYNIVAVNLNSLA